MFFAFKSHHHKGKTKMKQLTTKQFVQKGEWRVYSGTILHSLQKNEASLLYWSLIFLFISTIKATRSLDKHFESLRSTLKIARRELKHLHHNNTRNSIIQIGSLHPRTTLLYSWIMRVWFSRQFPWPPAGKDSVFLYNTWWRGLRFWNMVWHFPRVFCRDKTLLFGWFEDRVIFSLPPLHLSWHFWHFSNTFHNFLFK